MLPPLTEKWVKGQLAICESIEKDPTRWIGVAKAALAEGANAWRERCGIRQN